MSVICPKSYREYPGSVLITPLPPPVCEVGEVWGICVCVWGEGDSRVHQFRISMALMLLPATVMCTTAPWTCIPPPNWLGARAGAQLPWPAPFLPVCLWDTFCVSLFLSGKEIAFLPWAEDYMS